MFRITPEILETSHMSLAKPETNDDGQLPTGWHLLADWHFTPVILTAAQSAALPTSQQNAGTRAERLCAFCAKPKWYGVCVSEGVGDTEMDNLNYPALLPVEMPVDL